MEILYKSTRSNSQPVTASQAILQGLSEDGGLFVPTAIPKLDVTIEQLMEMSYQEVAYEVMSRFLTDFTEDELKHCINSAYDEKFDTKAIAPIPQAVKRGLKVIKFFPAEQFGGVTTIKALAAPYTSVKFMPTGGVSAKNLESYLSFDRIVACGGSWMVKGDLVKAGKFDEIKALTEEAVKLVADIRNK